MRRAGKGYGRNTYETRSEEGPSQVEASSQGAGGKGGLRDQVASLEEGNRPQEGKADALGMAMSDHLTKV